MLLTEVQLILGQNTDQIRAGGAAATRVMVRTLTHHQLREDGVQLLGGGHGQAGLQRHHAVDVVMAVSDLRCVVSFEAAGEKRGQVPPLVLLPPWLHDDLDVLPKHRQNIQLFPFYSALS